MMKNPNLRLVALAKMYIGVHEIGENGGPEVELFQRAVDGKASGEPWCCAFVQFLLKRAEEEFHLKSDLFRSESVWETWQKSPVTMRIQAPEPGDLMAWNIPGTERGHIGVYRRKLLGNLCETVEGNTNEAGSREGDGVYSKVRTMAGSKAFMVLGWLRPFHVMVS